MVLIRLRKQNLSRKLLQVVMCCIWFAIGIAGAEEKNTLDNTREVFKRVIFAENMQSFLGVFSYKRGGSTIVYYVHRQVTKDGCVKEIMRPANNRQGFVCPDDESGRCVERGFSNKVRMRVMLVPFAKDYIENVDANYTLALEPQELLVAGRKAQRLTLITKNEYHYSYTVVFDKETYSPLIYAFLDENNQPLEHGEFLQFTPLPAKEDNAANSSKGCLKPNPKIKTPKDVGWNASWLPAGMELINAIRQANALGQDEHLVYSDGLAFVSIFIESLSDARMVEMQSQFGATTIVSRKISLPSGRFLVTIVGEIPTAAAERIALSMSNETTH